MKAPIAILFANLKGNLGDFAILEAMLRDLNGRFPSHPLHVFMHPSTSVNETDLAAFRALAPPFELMGRTYAMQLPFYVKWLQHYRVWPYFQAHYVRKAAEKYRQQAEKFRGYEAVVAAGGEQWGRNPGASMFGAIKAIAAHNSSIYTYPFSIGPTILQYNSAAALRDYFQPFRQPIVVRDSMSHEILNRCDINNVLGIDCVFSLAGVAGMIAPMSNRDPSRTLLILTGKNNAAKTRIHALLTRLKNEIGPVELMSTTPPEDEVQFRRLGEEFGLAVRMPKTWQEAVAELKASSLIISNRLHALIFGSFGGAALLPVTNRTKVGAFVRDVGLSIHTADIGEISPELIRAAMANAQDIAEKLKSYRKRAEEGLFHPFLNQRTAVASA